MRRIARVCTVSLAVLAWGAALPSEAAGPKLKTLIIDGQNNHNWKSTTPVLKQVLEATGRFTVDVATSPGGRDMSSFNPEFNRYDVVVSNYTGAMWNERTRAAFVDYVRGGGGVVIYHAADNAFPQWPEWNEIIGLGGWGRRNEKSGPYVYWKDGRVVRDDSRGAGGSHGPQHAFEVINRVTDHPITKGLPTRWMHNKDELYGTLRGPAKNMTILSTAWSSPDKGGKGRHEPILMTISYGRGRTFHTVLGHDAGESTGCIGFRTTLARGAEWAATGRVTLAVADNFPAVMEPIDAVAAFDFGRPVAPLNELRATLYRGAGDPAKMAEYEERFVAMLRSAKTKFAARQFICRQLAFMGTRRSVPALQAMLSGDAKTSDVARVALQQMSASEANDALLAGLRSVTGASRIGIVNSLGVRADPGSVSALARLAGGRAESVAAAAIGALGRTGDLAALRALERSRGAPERVLDDALVRCAYTVARDGNGRDAARVFDRILGKTGVEKSLRVAALSGLLMAAPERAMGKFWQKLETDDPTEIAAVASVLGRASPTADLVRTVAARLAGMPGRAQVALLAILGAWRHPAAVPPITALVRESTDKDLRLAAIDALGKLPGDGESVRFLVSLAVVSLTAGADRDLQDRARAALVATGGAAAEDAIIAGLGETDAALREEYISVSGERRLAPAAGPLLRLAATADEATRISALKALRKLVGPDEYERLIVIAEEAPSTKVRQEAISAVSQAMRKIEDPDARAGPYVAALQRARGEVRADFIGGLVYVGGPGALDAARELAASRDQTTSEAAVRALAKWQDAEAIDTILEVAASTSGRPGRNKVHTILLMRGFSRLLPMAKDMKGGEKLDLCEKALAIGLETEATRLLMSTIASVASVRSMEIIEKMGRDPTLKKEAAACVATMRQTFLGAPSLRASHNGRTVSHAVDGDRRTRWDTGTPMKPGMWLQADMKGPAEIKAVVMDCRGSRDDYARGYEVYVSDDASKPGLPVASGRGDGTLTVVTLDRPARGRYVRIVQTGTSGGNHWAVHELSINYSTSFPGGPESTVKLADLLAKDGLVRRWDIAGPYSQGNADAKALFSIAFGPEVGPDFARWTEVDPKLLGGGRLNISAVLKGGNCVGYLRTVIVADRATQATLSMGSDDGVKAWLNGEVVKEDNAVRGHQFDQAKARVRLKAGRNKLLLKITQGGGGWEASARIRR